MVRTHDPQRIKDGIDPRAFYGRFFELRGGRSQQNVLCPFHDDHDPSLTLNLDSGLFHCKSPGCHAAEGGDVIGFWMLRQGVDFPTACEQIQAGRQPSDPPPRPQPATRRDHPSQPISMKVVDRYHANLMAAEHAQERHALEERRGWTHETLRRWRIGWDGSRYAIPVLDDEGRCENIRLYLPDPPDGESKFISYGKGHGRNRLFNVAALINDSVILCEGEPDVITAGQHGFDNALSGTLGAGNWDEEFNGRFQDKHVAVIYDIDDAGRTGAEAVAEQLASVAASVKVVVLPLDAGVHPHGDLSDFLRERGAEELRDCIRQTTPARREILWSPEIPEVIDQAEAALLAADTGIYQRAGQLARVAHEPDHKIRGVTREATIPTIEAAPKPWIRENMSRAADWSRKSDRGGKPTLPPEWAASTLMARGRWKFPPLAGIVHTPCLRPDGSLLSREGYDPATGLFHCSSISCPHIPDNPTREDALEALDTLWEPFQDFAFAGGDEDRLRKENWASALAALLTVLSRYTIDGALPMFTVSAPVRGSGKTRLVDTISIITTGHTATRAVQAANDEEERKRLVSLCLANDPLILIDNVEKPIKSAVLAAALTSRHVRDRMLGGNQMITVPMDGVWFVTGNNIQLHGDLSRRIVAIELDPAMEFPEERTGFHHEDLIGWVRKERPNLVAAALTILRAFVVAGSPQPSLPPYGSFEEWARLVRSCVVWITGVDPIAQRARLRTDADLEYEGQQDVLTAWEQEIGVGSEHALTSREVAEWCAEHDESILYAALRTLCSSKNGASLGAQQIGYPLRKLKGRILDGLLMQAGETTNQGRRWWVDRVAPAREVD